MKVKRSDRPEPTAEQSSVEGSPLPSPCLSGACYETTFDQYRIMMAAFSAVVRSGRYRLRSPCPGNSVGFRCCKWRHLARLTWPLNRETSKAGLSM